MRPANREAPAAAGDEKGGVEREGTRSVGARRALLPRKVRGGGRRQPVGHTTSARTQQLCGAGGSPKQVEIHRLLLVDTLSASLGPFWMM